MFPFPRMCDRCLAGTGNACLKEMDYRNFGPSKSWDLTLIDHDGYLSREWLVSPWLCMEGFQLETMSYDILHNVFLGTGRDLFASGVKTLVEKGVYDYTGLTGFDDILCHVEQRIFAKCKSHKFLSFSKMLNHFPIFSLQISQKIWA